MPVPAPTAARSYLAFFDWDRLALADRARQIIAEAAAASTRVQYTRIEVNGYTDTSGSARYNQGLANQGLSVRRAQAVAAELVPDSVPAAAIAIRGFGETNLLVSTGPGVHEPQNSRFDIIIRYVYPISEHCDGRAVCLLSRHVRKNRQVTLLTVLRATGRSPEARQFNNRRRIASRTFLDSVVASGAVVLSAKSLINSWNGAVSLHAIRASTGAAPGSA